MQSMRKVTRTLALLFPAIAFPLICSADPLNGGLGNAFAILLAIMIAGAVIIIAGLIAGIHSFKRASMPGTGAWVIVISSKLVALLFGYAFSYATSAYEIFDFIGNLSLVLILIAHERHLVGRRFMVCYVLHAILSICIIHYIFMFTGAMAGFYSPVLFIILRLLIVLLPATWYIYKLLPQSEAKKIDLQGWKRPMLIGFLICFGVYLAVSFPTRGMRSSSVSFFEHLRLLRLTFVGVFPYNIIMLTSFLLPGIVAYQLHKSRSQV